MDAGDAQGCWRCSEDAGEAQRTQGDAGGAQRMQEDAEDAAGAVRAQPDPALLRVIPCSRKETGMSLEGRDLQPRNGAGAPLGAEKGENSEKGKNSEEGENSGRPLKSRHKALTL